MATSVTGGIWSGTRVLLTGHTGFKGSWLAMVLRHLGAEVTGFALDVPTEPSLFEQAGVEQDLRDLRGDVADPSAVAAAVEAARPQLVLHLAAQPLVRAGYEDPFGTYRSNVLGTAAVLDAVRGAPDVRGVVVVTTDKCYANEEWPWAYREVDRLGGDDPYASSKAAAELVTAAFRSSYFQGPQGPAVASARAGNVIGGGDWAADRIVPDLVRAAGRGVPATVRRPDAVRPWQHVLDCLAGYVWLAERLLQGDRSAATAWNFGPAAEDARAVGAVADAFCQRWGGGASWRHEPDDGPKETNLLVLDSAKARRAGWRPVLGLDEAVEWVVEWHLAVRRGEDPRKVSYEQVERHLERQGNR